MFKRQFGQLIARPERGSKRGHPTSNGFVPKETVPEKTEIFMLIYSKGRIPNLVEDG